MSTMKENKKKKDRKPFCQPGNPWRDENGRYSSKEDVAVVTTGNTPPRAGCIGGKLASDDGETGEDNRKCGRTRDMKGKELYRCKDGEIALEESASDLRTIVEEEIRLALTRIFTRMNLKQEIVL